MAEVVRDIRQALRRLRTNPVSSAAIVCVLALGIAANTGMFAGFYAWVVRPLDFREPQHLVALSETQPRLSEIDYAISAPNLDDWRRGQSSFEGISAFARHRFGFRSDVDPERIDGARIEASLFPLLGAEPVLGRGFLAEEDIPGRPGRVALISDDLWRGRFDADPGVVGRTLWLDNQVHEVVGVMKPGFAFPEYADVWVPLGLQPSDHGRESRWLDVVGRLAPQASMSQARADLAIVAADLEDLYPATNEGWTAAVRPLREKWAPPVIRVALLVSIGAALFVMLVICANVAGLLLAQASARSRETALRAALGASRGRLIVQSIVECSVLTALGGVAGLPLAYLFNQWMLSRAPLEPPYLFAMTIDYSAVAYTFFVALLAGAVCGLAPVIRNSRIDVFGALKNAAGRSSAPRSAQRFRMALVIAELGLSTALVIGSFLMVRSFLGQQRVDPGHRVDGVLTAELSLSGIGFESRDERLAVLHRSLSSTLDLAGVESAGAAKLDSDRLPIHVE